MRRIVILTLLLLCLGSTLQAQQGGLLVDASQSLGTISPYVYGANYGPLSAVTVELIPQAQESGITFLRFPGGRWGDLNNIQPAQIDMFMRTVRMIGAEPNIHVRLENGTPEQAAELVRYTNIEKEYNVRYWSVGNEPNLFDDYTTIDHNTQWRAIAEAMLEVDPEIILIGPDVSQWAGIPGVDPIDPEGRDWLREFLLANGDMIDIVTVHRYPFPRDASYPVTTIDDLRGNAAEWSAILPNLRAVIEETTGRTDLPVAVTEANSHWSGTIRGEATPDSHFNAIWWADALGRMINEQPAIVAYFELQTQDARGGWGILSRFEVRPTYYTYQLYQRFGTELLHAESAAEQVSIYAALRDDGALTLMVVNLADDPQTVPLDIQGFTPGEGIETYRLDPEHQAELVDSPDLSEGALTLPGQSVTLYIIPQAG
ncbi:MAG: hypothetical protein JXN59_12915 [Anaerolineae bacterium]|nr:hypothetical protein [Anaerolineae bacterium]